MPRFPLLFGMTLAWCCGRSSEHTPIQGEAASGAGGSIGGGGAGTDTPTDGGMPASGAAGGEPEGGSGQPGSAGAPPTAGAGTASTEGGRATPGGAETGGATGSGTSGMETGGSGGIAVGGTSANTGGSAGEPPIVTRTLCDLIEGDPRAAASELGALYRNVLFRDCRYAALSCGVAVENKIAQANSLTPTSLALWHCAGSSVTRFNLVYPGRTVTTVDANALIEVYLALTLQSLPFTPSDAVSIREELRKLAETAIDENAAPISLCNDAGTWDGCTSGGSSTGGTSTSGTSTGGTSTGGTSGTGGSAGAGAAGESQ